MKLFVYGVDQTADNSAIQVRTYFMVTFFFKFTLHYLLLFNNLIIMFLKEIKQFRLLDQ